MKIPVVNQCCCGCTLRTGCLIVAWLWSASSLLELVGSSVWADAYGDLAGSSTQHEGSYNAIRGFTILNALVTTAQLIVSLCLVYGVTKFKTKFISPWLYTCTAAAVIRVLIIVSVTIVYFAGLNVGLGFAVLIGGGLGISLTVYCLLVVNSFYLMLQEDAALPMP